MYGKIRCGDNTLVIKGEGLSILEGLGDVWKLLIKWIIKYLDLMEDLGESGSGKKGAMLRFFSIISESNFTNNPVWRKISDSKKLYMY